jgi:hypothetical protein
MTRPKILVLLCTFAAFSSIGTGAEKEPGQKPQELISQVLLKQELRSEGTPPFIMRAELEVLGANGGLIHGEYRLDWISPLRWKEVVSIGDYERVRVRDAKGYWQKCSLDYQPEAIFQLDKLLHFRETIKVRANQSLSSIKKREKDGIRQKCTEVRWQMGSDKILCFDDTNGMLLNVEYLWHENQNHPEISQIEYHSFQTVAGKLIPREILAYQNRRIVAAVKILDISTGVESGSANFNIPPDSEFWAYCDDMSAPELKVHVQPQYPSISRLGHEEGRVILYAIVEIDGSPSHLAVIQKGGPNLDLASTEAVSKWRYKPATCEQSPVRAETSIAIDYWLPN